MKSKAAANSRAGAAGRAHRGDGGERPPSPRRRRHEPLGPVDQARLARRWALVAALFLLMVAAVRWADAGNARRVEMLRLEERALRVQRDALADRLRAATAPGPVGAWARANGFVPTAEAAQSTLRRVPDDRPPPPPEEPPVSLRTVLR